MKISIIKKVKPLTNLPGSNKFMTAIPETPHEPPQIQQELDTYDCNKETLLIFT